MSIIGISGYARTGKDSIASHLVEAHGYERAAFADGVRAMALELDVPLLTHRGDILSYREASKFISDDRLKARTNLRTHLVQIGAGARRVLGPEVWVRRVEEIVSEPGDWVIPDVRYANEAEMIERHGGVVIRVERPGFGPANDEEKRSLDEFSPPLWILNDGSLSNLKQIIHEILRNIRL